MSGTEGSVRCDACPVLCNIRPDKTGVCGRFGNHGGVLTREDPLLVLERLQNRVAVEGDLPERFVTGVGAGTTYPDYKPAPFIVSSRHRDVDMVTVVTEGIFSYCGFKVKVDTDRYLGPEQGSVYYQGEQVGHVTSAEYGSQMMSLGGVHHLTGGSKAEGKATVEMMEALGNREPVELQVAEGAQIVVQSGKPPVVNGKAEHRMRVGCGSATIGMFAQQWHGHVDEVIVVDDHITGVLTEHQAGRYLDIPPSGIRVRGQRSTPGRYFQVANPGLGWGGTDINDPLTIIESINPRKAWAGLRLLMVSTTGEDAAYFVLDGELRPMEAEMPGPLRQVVQRIDENCEPALCTVLFMAGAGGSLRAGTTENPVALTRSVKEGLTRVTVGGAPVYVWPGGGITLMADVSRMPAASFGRVPTPAIVAPVEFTMALADYAAMGGHIANVVPIEQVTGIDRMRLEQWDEENPWPLNPPTPAGPKKGRS